VPTYNDEAVVLRTHKLGEADRIITLLTRGHGKVRAVAKGVRRSTSKFGARLEPFSHVDLQLVVGRSLDIVAQVVSMDAFGEPLMSDYPRYTAGNAMLEAADRLVGEEGEPSVQHYLLLVGALRALGTGDDRPSAQILDSYLLRALAIAGYAPSLGECALCGGKDRLEFFNSSTGGMVCLTCRPSGSSRIDISTAAHLGALLAGDWVGVAKSPASVQRTASGLVSAFAAWHIERGLRSLAHVER
jgi:DNA repair protein RecO (recombination protein O)